ncbi:MAG: hypothetical protein RLZZ200_1798 [Pseudomonadota bacterium]
MGGLASCSPPAKVLRVGTNDFPGYELLYLARDLGYFDDARIQLLGFPSATEVIRAYKNGALDVAAITADEAMLASPTGERAHVILVLDASAGTDAIIANPRLTSVPALRGHRIGVETGALGSYVLSRALELHGMSPLDVQVVALTMDSHEAGYRDGLVDAVVTFDPVSDRLEAAGAIRVFDSRQIPHEILDVLISQENAVANQRKELLALVRGWLRAQDYLRLNRADALRRLAARVSGRTPDQYGRALDRLEIPDRAQLLRWLGSGPDNLEPQLSRLSEHMVRLNLMPKGARPNVELDPSIVRDALP